MLCHYCDKSFQLSLDADGQNIIENNKILHWNYTLNVIIMGHFLNVKSFLDSYCQ